MGPDASPEVKVIFDASSRGRRRGKTVDLSRRRSRPPLWIALGVLNLIASAAAYYLTWWKVDPFIYMTFLFNTPVPGLSLSDVDRAFAGAPGAPLVDDVLPDQPESTAPRLVGMQATGIIGATAYSWLTLATCTMCALALAGGSLLARSGGSMVRRVGWILLATAVALSAYAVFQTLSEYGQHYPVRHLRVGMGGLAVLALLLGLVLGHRTRGLCRLAAIATILGGVATAAALYVGHLCGAIDAERATPAYLAAMFIAVSAWGWLLLPLGSRFAR